MTNRILSLDVFRGITIFAMLIVNNPGSWGHIYPIFKHAKWHGFGGADWIFPFFIFIIGFAIPISISHQFSKGKSLFAVYYKIVKRSIILFFLGIFLNGFPDFNWETIRIPGVLQRIAIVYFFSAILFLNFRKNWFLVLSILFLILHWIILTQIPVPSIGEANLVMGKNLAGWIDYYFLPNHLWVHSKTWDPEGILGTLPAISSCLFGVYFGLIFLEGKKITTYQFYFSLFLGILLVSLSFLWDIVFPINKSLWTGSFVILTTGFSIIALPVLYYLIDELKSKVWFKGFEILGRNALAVFFLSSLLSKILNIPFIFNAAGKKIGIKIYLYTQYFSNTFSPFNASLFWSLVYTFLWLILFVILNWFILFFRHKKLPFLKK